MEEEYFLGIDTVRMNEKYKVHNRIKIFVDPNDHKKSAMVDAISEEQDESE